MSIVMLVLAGCATPPPPYRQAPLPTRQYPPKPYVAPPPPVATPARPYQTRSRFQLPDKVQFMQTDSRWASETLGGSGESLRNDGCLVTAAAMALVNLGFDTNPGDLTYRLKSYGGFTSQGWLVWSGLEKATSGQTKTVFYNAKSNPDKDMSVRSCLAANYYPLVRFALPNGNTHWAMVVGDTSAGFYVRDPMVNSSTPIPLSTRTSKITAVRCIGVRA